MPYVIYNKETTKILTARARSVGCYIESYKSTSAAKAALTRLDKKGLLGVSVETVPGFAPNGLPQSQRIETAYVKSDFAIADKGDFHSTIEKTVTSINAMTGEEFQESINANFSTSPASENYWCS